MLRVTTENTKNGTAIKLEGKLAGAWVDEVERTWHLLADERTRVPLLVDLCGVTFIDAQGKELLKEMYGEGAVFRCCDPDITATVEGMKREILSKGSSLIRHRS